jgi:hypothetical protein
MLDYLPIPSSAHELAQSALPHARVLPERRGPRVRTTVGAARRSPSPRSLP